MTKRDREFEKQIDLHESEWRKEGKNEPIFGAGAGWFVNVALPLLILVIFLKFAGGYLWRYAMGY